MIDQSALQSAIRQAVAVELQPLRDELRRVQDELRFALSPQAKQPQREKWQCREVAELFGIKDVETVRRWCKNFVAGQGKYIMAEQDEYSGRWLIPQSEVDYLREHAGNPRSFSQAA